MISKNKLTMNHTYLTTTNYWAPLNDDTDEKNDKIEQINIIPVKQPIVNTKSNKWTHRIERRRTEKLIIDSGATSNFVTEEKLFRNIFHTIPPQVDNRTLTSPNKKRIYLALFNNSNYA